MSEAKRAAGSFYVVEIKAVCNNKRDLIKYIETQKLNAKKITVIKGREALLDTTTKTYININ